MTDHLGGGLVDMPDLPIVLIFYIAVRNRGADALSVGGLHRPDSPDLLAGLGSIPFVENVVEGHHFCAGASQRVHVLLNRNELHTQRGIYNFKKTAYLQVVSAEAGEVLHNDRADLPGLDQCLHFLEARTFKGGTADAVVIEKYGMQIAVFLCVVL